MGFVSLGEIGDFQSGGTPSKSHPEYFGGEIPWITTVALNGDFIDGKDAVDFLTEDGVNFSATKIVSPYALMVGTRVGVGKVAINTVPMCTNQDIISIINIDLHRWNLDYLRYVMRNASKFLNAQARGATIKGIKIDVLQQVQIPDISMETQDETVARLNIVQKLIQSRKMQLEQLDTLIKARFVEMFGDPAINPYNWNIVNITEIIKGKVSNGFFAKRDDYCDEGNVQVLGVANVVNRMYSEIKDLPKTNGTDKDIEKYQVQYGDMLFCRSSLVAEGIGKASIVPENVFENVLFECHVIRLPLDLDKCVPEFIQVFSTMPFFRNQIIAQSKTATMTTIGQDGILKADIILPPIQLQQQFYNFIKQVDKSKVIDLSQLLKYRK